MDRDPDKVLNDLAGIEEVAEDILADKQHIVDLDKKRQKTREAIRILSKDKTTNKTWVCFGDMFLKLPKNQVTRMLDKDFDQLDEELVNINRNLKPKMNKLRDLENKDELKGFNLQPLEKAELKAMVI